MFDLNMAHWRDRRLSTEEKVVLAVMAVTASADGHSRESVESLAEFTGLSSKKVTEALLGLELDGWLTRRNSEHLGLVWDMAIPEVAR